MKSTSFLSKRDLFTQRPRSTLFSRDSDSGYSCSQSFSQPSSSQKEDCASLSQTCLSSSSQLSDRYPSLSRSDVFKRTTSNISAESFNEIVETNREMIQETRLKEQITSNIDSVKLTLLELKETMSSNQDGLSKATAEIVALCREIISTRGIQDGGVSQCVVIDAIAKSAETHVTEQAASVKEDLSALCEDIHSNIVTKLDTSNKRLEEISVLLSLHTEHFERLDQVQKPDLYSRIDSVEQHVLRVQSEFQKIANTVEKVEKEQNCILSAIGDQKNALLSRIDSLYNQIVSQTHVVAVSPDHVVNPSYTILLDQNSNNVPVLCDNVPILCDNVPVLCDNSNFSQPPTQAAHHPPISGASSWCDPPLTTTSAANHLIADRQPLFTIPDFRHQLTQANSKTQNAAGQLHVNTGPNALTQPPSATNVPCRLPAVANIVAQGQSVNTMDTRKRDFLSSHCISNTGSHELDQPPNTTSAASLSVTSDQKKCGRSTRNSCAPRIMPSRRKKQKTPKKPKLVVVWNQDTKGIPPTSKLSALLSQPFSNIQLKEAIPSPPASFPFISMDEYRKMLEATPAKFSSQPKESHMRTPSDLVSERPIKRCMRRPIASVRAATRKMAAEASQDDGIDWFSQCFEDEFA